MKKTEKNEERNNKPKEKNKQGKVKLFTVTEETGTAKHVNEKKKRTLNEKSVFTIGRLKNRTLATEKEKMVSSPLKNSHSGREPVKSFSQRTTLAQSRQCGS